jgi:GT2 family glycosyltransferase
VGIVVNWYGDEDVRKLVDDWPEDRRFDLIVVDNSSSLGGTVSRARVLDPGENLGFGGAVNAGLRSTDASVILILNSDARPIGSALERLVEGFEQNPEVAGLAPKLLSADGTTQHRWQLRPLPSTSTLLLQSLMIPAGEGPEVEPNSGTVVEQPAAAALALRRSALQEIGGFEEAFFPAWFEDVDLARRMADANQETVYWPEAAFEHLLGSSVTTLGYERFLWIYYRNLGRYLSKHHSNWLAILARTLTALAATARVPLLALRRPSRAASRREALDGLTSLLLGALSGWRLPSSLSRDPLCGSRTADGGG